ncbi:CocE/NonD family hydrolase [Nocardioides litoris]|uniref:CocE/NonD family hydrolase n=1 Tax=Nocardioides litoris TaxID=1926648 RepID=UPI0011236784|nr:CocE/NonD family hydrolase [Nocardioides litoris]
MRRTATVLLLLLGLLTPALVATSGPSVAAPATVTVATGPVPAPLPAGTTKSAGYIRLPDGTRLKYTLLLPRGKGPFPTLMQYEGYFAGSDPTRANDTFVPRMLAKGYAVIGVSLRGSACSTGTWELFNRQQGKDGAYAVDWAGRQRWSNGRVAMYSYSYGGIMQAWVAAERPKHLVAITPANIVGDTYRDIGFPGGIYNTVFPPEWGLALNQDWLTGGQKAAADGDLACLATAAAHVPGNAGNQLAVQAPRHPFADGWHRSHSIAPRAGRINVPALVVQSWQDEETGGRGGHFFERMDPRKTWMISTNGHHLMYQFSPRVLDTLARFYDFHVKGIRNGFGRTPKVQVWHETTNAKLPRSVTTRRSLPVKVEATPLYLRPGGSMGATPVARADGRPFLYPLPSPAVVDTSAVNLEEDLRVNTWSVQPYVGAGRAVFTSPRLARTMTTYGSSSADLWISSTARDVDLQVTITEVRPDGQEVYVQRGWLRASHRALDARRSTALRPWHPHTAKAQRFLTPGRPQLARVEVMPFGHTFRAGSSVRMYVENPGVTGLWGFLSNLTPQTVTVHSGKRFPSRLVLGLLPRANVKKALPSCAQMHSEPCRPNPVPRPPGVLRLPR